MLFCSMLMILLFQSTLPTRGSDNRIYFSAQSHESISIHAPHEGERLLRYGGKLRRAFPISIHAPHEGERLVDRLQPVTFRIFQSTLPTRGSDAMERGGWKTDTTIFQSTLPTRGSDPTCYPTGRRYSYFNPRSPRGGATIRAVPYRKGGMYFNPRSPRGGATLFIIYKLAI